MNLAGFVKPKPTLSDGDVARGLRMMTWEGAASLGTFSVATSGLLAGFALALGANNLQIGMLAAIPFLSQVIQVPAIALVERLRWRKAITLATWIPAQITWALMALIPFIAGVPSPVAVGLLLALLAIRGIPIAVSNCSWNSWIRDLVPQTVMGRFFSRRLAWGTIAAIALALGGALFVDWWQAQSPPGKETLGYTYAILTGAVLMGLVGVLSLLRAPEPAMETLSGPRPSLWEMVSLPFRDRNFRQLINFLFLWGFAVNLAVPFLTVFMLQRLGFSLSAVIALNILSQLAMALLLRVWGALADRFGSKVVLSLSASLYLLVILGWAFTTLPDPHLLTMPLVVMLQIFAGTAAAGVNLTISTIGLKLAPRGQATSYLVVASLATNLGTGLGPLAGGLLADLFSDRRFSLNFEWADGSGIVQFPAVHLVGYDFLFTIAVLIGLVTMKTLTTIREEGEVSREEVLEELWAPTRDMARTIGAIPGLRFVGGFPYAYLRRMPGVDVALGVTAYEMASMVKSALITASRGGSMVRDIEGHVRRTVCVMASQTDELGQHGLGLARHAARGAMHVLDELAWDVGHLSKGAVLGAMSALGKTSAEPWDILWGASYGAVQGAGEMGASVSEAATQAVEGAREAARLLDLPEEEAVSQATRGILAAVESMNDATAAQVREALGGALT